MGIAQLNSIGALIVAFFDLLEAEGRLLRRGVTNLWYSLVLVAIAGLLVLIGLALWVWAAYEFVAPQAGSGTGALVAGLVAMVEAGIAIWIIHTLRR